MNNKITNFLLFYMNMRGWIYENLFFGIQIRLIYNPILPKSPTDSVVSARHLNTYLIFFQISQINKISEIWKKIRFILVRIISRKNQILSNITLYKRKNTILIIYYNYTCSSSGTEGFEPPNSGTKTRCLTTWPRPTLISIRH